MKAKRAGWAAAVLLATGGSVAWADPPGEHRRHAQPGSAAKPAPALPHYDVNAVLTVKGEVLEVSRHDHGRFQGVHARLKTTAGEELEVHLGPGFFVDKLPVKVAPKDLLQVTGSRVMVDGVPSLLAAEVKKGDQTLQLRDRFTGKPYWSSPGRGS